MTYISKTRIYVVRKKPTQTSFNGLRGVDWENMGGNERMALFLQAKDAFLC
jgi:hypothetical protein